MAKQKMMVIGGLGIIGRNFIGHLEEVGGWEIVALSRRKPDFKTKAEFISVDLRDPSDIRKKLGGIKDLTHIMYAALDGGIAGDNVNANTALLVNPINVLEPINPKLERIVLQEGGKVYGRHIGPFKTPAKESDARHLPPNFYYNQEDFLRKLQKSKKWTWSALRPEPVIGFAVGNAMNLATQLAVYASVCKSYGMPLDFPGKIGTWNAVSEMTDAGLLARATLFAASSPKAANQAYNVTNGTFFRWRNIWASLAKFFDMEMGEVRPMLLSNFMADKAPVWDSIVKKHKLQPYKIEDLAAWPFIDFVMQADWDVALDNSKRIQHGFADTIDTGEMFLNLFARLRREKIIP